MTTMNISHRLNLTVCDSTDDSLANDKDSGSEGNDMKRVTGLFVVALFAIASTGCTFYKVAAQHKEEGTAWISDGAQVWYCASDGQSADCKKVLK